MIMLRLGFRGIFALGMILVAFACSPENTPSGAARQSIDETRTADCPGCLLRERIKSAQPGETINIPAGTYTMTGGELVIDKDLTLVGEGAEVTVIQAAGSLDLSVHRVIRIAEGSVVSISRVTIRYGKESSKAMRMIPFHSEAIGMPSSGIEKISAEFGGGIYNQGTLALTDSIVTENYAGGGGGIFNGAKITIKNSSITGNRAGGYGGGIFNGGVLHAANIVVEDNVAGAGAGINNWGEAFVIAATIKGNQSNFTGGGIDNASIGVLTLDSTTVSHNESPIGGGIDNFGRLQIFNSTISNNTANFGAGIDNRWMLTLANSTISGNIAREGGGLVMRPAVPSEGASIFNTILSGNSAGRGPDCMGVVASLGHNLVGTDSGCEFIAVEWDSVGTKARPIDAKLGRLDFNGGPTATNALLPGSPAIDAGDNGSCPPVDQRGVPRPRGTSCDIGSYER